MPVDNNDIVVIEDVIMSKNMSKFGIAVITLIFKLERRPKAQNVGNLLAILMLYSILGTASG